MLVKLQFKALPFHSTRDQVFYISGTHDEQLETFITAHLDSLQDAFSPHGLTFVHVPSLCKQIEDNRTFYAPYAVGVVPTALQSDWLLSYLVETSNASKVAPMLLFFCGENAEACYGLTIDAWKTQTEQELLQLFTDLADDIVALTTERTAQSTSTRTSTGTRYSLRIPKTDVSPDADQLFDAESQKLIEEVQERIKKLRDNGLSAALINSLFHQEETLSPLRIDGDYRLWLTAYDNVEIRMTPLVKAVFLLFVSHPEGILFKHLADYRTELRNIYTELRRSTLTLAEEASINRLTDPFDNSINEKCARIREAFCREMRPSLAEHYVINGQRGEAKKMVLPRELILWD